MAKTDPVIKLERLQATVAYAQMCAEQLPVAAAMHTANLEKIVQALSKLVVKKAPDKPGRAAIRAEIRVQLKSAARERLALVRLATRALGSESSEARQLRGANDVKESKPAETSGIWEVLGTIVALSSLLDGE